MSSSRRAIQSEGPSDGGHGAARRGELVRTHVEANDIRTTAEAFANRARLLDVVGDPVLAWRMSHGIIYWNRAAEQFYGYRGEEALGRTPYQLLRTEFPVGLTAAEVESILADRDEWFGELVHTTRDGRRVVVDARLRRIDHDVILEMIRDASDRKRAEARAHARTRQQEVLAALGQGALSSEDFGALLADAAARIADVLAVGLVQVLELSDDGRSLLMRGGSGWGMDDDAAAPIGVGTDSQAGFALLAGEPVVVTDLATERRFAIPDRLRRHNVRSGVSLVIPGQPRPYGVLSVHARVARDFTPDEIHFLRAVANVIGAVIRDNRAARALRDSEARMRAVVDTAVDPIITIDQRGLMESVNPAACRLFGYEAAELIGRNVSILMPEPYRGHHDGYLDAYLRTGQARIIGIGREVVGQRKDGSTFPLDLAVSEFTVNGRRMFTGLIRDLTERRRLERQILDAGAEEQRRIGHDLHDGLCQQLTGCAFALEVLGQKLEARAAPETASIRKVSDLVDQAITQARTLAHGLQPVTLEATGLAAALRDLAAKAESMFGVACMFVSEGTVLVHDNTVATHLYRIAQEAISNAVKHGKAKTVIVDLSATDDELRLTITDDGVGLTGSAAPGKQKGIGLETMGYRARIIGGTLDVRPGRRGGTTVLCTVPIVSDNRSEKAEHGSKDPEPKDRPGGRRGQGPGANGTPADHTQAPRVRRRRPPDRP